MSRILDFIFGGLTNKVLDVIEWYVAHGGRPPKSKPFGGLK